MNSPDDTEIRRLVAAALGTGLMQWPAIVEAAAAFLVTRTGYSPHPPGAAYHTLDHLVDEILWGVATGNKGVVYRSSIQELKQLFPPDPDPDPDPDAQD